MKKRIKIIVAILMMLTVLTSMVTSVNADYCENPYTDPDTGITTCRS